MQPAPPATYEDLAGTLDHALVEPNLSSVEVLAGIDLAKRYGVACVSVRPCDVDLAVRTLAGSRVRPGSVVGFPHGSQNTATKLYEARDLLRRGARELAFTIAISALLSHEFDHVQTELAQMAETCRQAGAVLKVVLENAYLTGELKIVACRCCARAGVDFVATSTGFAPSGYSLEDVRLMRQHLPEEIGVEAAGGLRTLDQALEARAAGATLIGTASTAAILDEWKARLTAAKTSTPGA